MNQEHIDSKTLVAGTLSILLAAVVSATGLDLARVEPGSESPLFRRTERALIGVPGPGTPMGPEVGPQALNDTPESLSGSVVTFHGFGADQSCVTPGAQHRICFRADSPAAADREVESLWLRFPAGWTVASVFLGSAPYCSGGGSFGGFSWVPGFLNNEVRIDHQRIQVAGSECSATYCLDVTAGSWAPGFQVSWYWKGRPDTVPAPLPPHYPCSGDLYTPLGQPACDEAVHPQARVGGWQQVAPMDVAPGRTVAAAWDGQVWSMANQNRSGNGNAVRRYDPVTDVWTTVPDSGSPGAVEGTSYSGCHVGEKVFIYQRSSQPAQVGLWSYDMAANEWTQESPAGTPPDPADIWFPSWAFDPASGLCYMTGGLDEIAFASLNTVFVYDPAANEWLAPLPGFDTPRAGHAAFVIDGKLCLLGGHDFVVVGNPQALASTQCFDLSTHSWNLENADIPPLPEAAGGLCYTSTAGGNRLWIIGGASDGFEYLPVEESFFYDLDAGAWQTAGAPASGSLAYCGAAVQGNTVYHAGGYRYQSQDYWYETPITGRYAGGPCGGPHPLAVVIEGEGSVELAPDMPGYYLGENVQLTAVPAPGWEFAGWSGDAGGTDNPIEVTVTGEMAVIASFFHPLTITSQSPLPDGFLGVEYLFAFSAAGGEPPYTWSVVAGALPPGLNLDAASGVLVGTPTSLGSSAFTVQVADAANETAQGIFEIEVLTEPANAVPFTERQVLIALYESTNGAGWTNRANWRLPGDLGFNHWGTECTWHGVLCNPAGTSVTGIILLGNNLVGVLPAAVAELTNLEILRVSGNQLSGAIPVELANLANLLNLWLHGNEFSGPIPPALGNLANLRVLSLHDNLLTGTIPVELANLEQLVSLSIDRNQISGSIPPQLSQMEKLELLGLGANLLTGPVPPELGGLSNLRRLYLHSNQLTGSIPPELGNLKMLDTLWLNNNQLSGAIPAQMGNLTRLEFLALSTNQLSGAIPSELGSLSNLQYLILQANQLEGPIPAELGNLTELLMLWLSSNRLAGELPATLMSLPYLGPIDLRWNGLLTSNPALAAFLDARQTGGDWQSTQTVAPEDVAATDVTTTTASLSWTPIPYTGNTGEYQVFLAYHPAGPYSLVASTPDKFATGISLVGLTPGANHFAAIRTLTYPHDDNANSVLSDPSPPVAFTTVSDGTFALGVGMPGTGSGIVTSDPAGIDCGSTCSASFPAGTMVTLSAEAALDSVFLGWDGEGCSGTGECVVTMNAARSVAAIFTLGILPLQPVAGRLDPEASATSNGNLMLEPGETVVFHPAWHNPGLLGKAVTGFVAPADGPGGAHIHVLDGVADYGTIPGGETRDSREQTGNSYALHLPAPAQRPSTLWRVEVTETLSTGEVRTWRIHVGDSFVDVGVDHWAYRFIETLLHSGVTAGCSPTQFCPGSAVTRWQMGVFLAKAMAGDEALLPVSGEVPGMGEFLCIQNGLSVFSDVSPEDPACRHIHYIASEGITVGCGGGLYCPAQEVTRWQMGVFLAKAMVGDEALLPNSGTVPGLGDYVCGVGGVSVFADVSPENPACRHIHFIASEGVTVGCGGGNYCPEDDLSRAEMAVFLVKAFGLSLGGAEQQQEITVMLPGDVPLVMVRIPAGVFMMGAPTTERGYWGNEGPQHHVTLTQDYYLGKYPVTQGQWLAVMGSNPSWFTTCGLDCPVERISWNEICGGSTGSNCIVGSFIGKLNAHLAATGQPGAGKFRMPTEAEWERGARGGTTGPFSFDVSGNPNWDLECGAFPQGAAHMWWCANAGGTTHPVGQKLPNPFGLYDVHGLVWELVGDFWGDYTSGPEVDPTGPSTGSYRVVRGGSWYNVARRCRSAGRYGYSPGYRYAGIGFRLARSL